MVLNIHYLGTVSRYESIDITILRICLYASCIGKMLQQYQATSFKYAELAHGKTIEIHPNRIIRITGKINTESYGTSRNNLIFDIVQVNFGLSPLPLLSRPTLQEASGQAGNAAIVVPI